MTAPARLSEPDVTPSLSPILIVDDSKAQRRLLTRTLERWGYETVEASSGDEALGLCEGATFDIIISDWMMPGMSGVEFCRAFRALSKRPSYFILLTAQTEREILAEGLESGADDFLSKPFHAVELRARLRAGRRSVQAQKALADQNLKLSNALQDLSDAYAAIDRDLKGARVFQEGLVPNRHVSFGKTDISLLFRSSGHVGGDLVGYFPVNAHEIGVYSVDVSGHGVASALMTARIAGFFSATAPDRNIALRATDQSYEMVPLPEVLEALNAILMKDAESDQYLTLAIARIELRNRTVDLCQAGHTSPAILHKCGAVEFIELWSTPLGLVDEGEYASTTLKMNRGDRLILYSDGVTECPDPEDRLLEEGGFRSILQNCAHLRGPHFVEGLTQRLIGYLGNDDFPDDVSGAVVDFR